MQNREGGGGWRKAKEVGNRKWEVGRRRKKAVMSGQWLVARDAGDEGEDRVREAFGPNYDRLLALKNKYDPANFFRPNANIKPTV
jgi:FAD/FMN-containing dehydrogenase